MPLFSNLNKGGIDWGINTEDLKYIKLSELNLDEVIQICGVFLNTKGNFGTHPVAIIKDALLDLPAHQTETVQEILNSPAMIEGIKEGKCGIKVRPYKSTKYNKDCLSVEWVDIK